MQLRDKMLSNVVHISTIMKRLPVQIIVILVLIVTKIVSNMAQTRFSELLKSDILKMEPAPKKLQGRFF
jgi:hypothetical protein